jgi:hypothetical protein
MNLASKTFRNNKTGETIKVIDTFENIVILENKQKIDLKTLMDTNQFTEQIDPSSFFNNQGAYNALAEKIKTIPIDNMIDDSIIQNFGDKIQPATNESAIIQTTEEDEMAELAKKYGVSMNADQDAVSKQNESFQKILNPEERNTQPVTRIDIDNKNVQPVAEKIEDPIITMFRNVKRNVNFDISIDISNKIPRLDFIEMMEDSYEKSIIDFFADEFTNQILNNPSKIKESISEKIRSLVYGESKKTNDQDDVRGFINNTQSKKLGVGERIELISKLTSIGDIEIQLKSEKSKSVISAGNKRIKELKNN